MTINKKTNIVLQLLCMVPWICAAILATSCRDDPWAGIKDRENYCIERRNKSGELILYERVVGGKRDGYYRINNVSPFLVNKEGQYDHGVKVGLWRSWYRNGRLEYEEWYAPTASVARIGHMEIRNEQLLSSRDYDCNGMLVGVTTNGVGVRVKTFYGNPPIRSSFDTMGFPTNYFISYNSEQTMSSGDVTKRLRVLEVTERLPDGGDAIRRRIVWTREGGKLSEVLEQPVGSHKTRRHVLFDTSGNVSYSMGEKPDFLNGVPFVAPVLQSNLLIFCERISHTNGKTVVDFLPEKEHKVIELW